MNSNKLGIIVSLFFTLVSLLGSIFSPCGWWSNFSFSILGGSLFSIIICCVNYMISLRETVESIVLHIYNGYNLALVEFLATKQKDPYTLLKVLNILNETLHYSLIKNYYIYLSLFHGDRRKKEILSINNLLNEKIDYIASMSNYIELYYKEATAQIKTLSRDLELFVKDNDIYYSYVKIAKKFNSSIKTRGNKNREFEEQKILAKKYRKTFIK